MSEQELPKGWAWVTLDDVAMRGFAAITDGPFGSNLKTEHYVDAGPRVLRLQNIGDGQFMDEHAHIPEAHFQTLRKHEVISGDVLIAMLGEALPRSCLAPANLGPAIVKADCVRARVDPEIASASYISHALNCYQTRRRAASIVHGVGRPRLNLGEIRTLPIPMAPRPEQDRITASIEQHLSDVEAGAAAIERTLANLKRYRASVLKAACEGRLVPTEAELARKEKRDYEPADVLLRRILKERRARWEADQLAKMKAKGQTPKDDKWKARYEEPISPDDETPREQPVGWSCATIDQLSHGADYGTSAKTSEEATGVPVLRMGNIVEGKLVLDDLKYLPRSHPEFPDLFLAPGDMVFNRTNSAELVGKTAVYQGAPVPCSFASYLIRVRLVAGSLPDYVSAVINSPLGRAWVAAVVSQQVGQANVNGSKLKALVIPLPPREEQIRIVERMNMLLSDAEMLADTLRAQLARAARLRQAVLKRAFEGKLVPQDPNDEPASALLARLRAEQPPEPTRPARGRPRRAARTSEP